MYRYQIKKRYVRDNEPITASVGSRTNLSTGYVEYWTEAEWYGIADEDFDTLEEACAFLERQGFTEVNNDEMDKGVGAKS